MDLILWRHAEAKEARSGVADSDRPLTPKGERQARRMAHWLNQHLPDTTRVLVSPTLRTRQTAEHLERKHRVVPTLGADGTMDTLLQVCRWPEAKEPVLVVGHQTALGLTVAYLLAGQIDTWSFRKGSVWWLRHRERRGKAETVLHLVASPEYV